MNFGCISCFGNIKKLKLSLALEMKAHSDTKLKKPKSASGILMIRQNSFHEILSLLCHLVLVSASLQVLF